MFQKAASLVHDDGDAGGKCVEKMRERHVEGGKGCGVK